MITFDNFSGASLSFLIVNLFVVALLGVVILAAYRRRIRTLMRGGDAIAVNLPPEKPGGLQLRFNIITTPLTEHAPTQRFSILFDVLESVREHFYLLQSFLIMRRMEAKRMKLSAERLRFSQSFARRRQRLSQAMVRSTIHRFGNT